MNNVIRLRERIILQRPTVIQDSMGGYSQRWVDFITVWAEVAPVSMKMLSLELSPGSGNKIEFPCYCLRLRYGAPLSTRVRIKWREKSYGMISPPLVDPHRQWIEVTIRQCSEQQRISHD